MPLGDVNFSHLVVIILLAFGIFYLTSKPTNRKASRKSKMGDHEIFEDGGLNNFCQQLWESDQNRLVPGQDYELDLGGRTRYSYNGPDMADDPLFTWVKPEVFERPTYKAFIKLLDNYESETGTAETVTNEELQENNNFINLIFQTQPVQLAYRFLKYRGKFTDDVNYFKRKFYNIWFKMYKRDRQSNTFDSCGFEHVFVGETRGRNEVIGFPQLDPILPAGES